MPSPHRVLVYLDGHDLEVILAPPLPPQSSDAAVPELVAHIHQPGMLSVLASRRKLKNRNKNDFCDVLIERATTKKSARGGVAVNLSFDGLKLTGSDAESRGHLQILLFPLPSGNV